MNITDFESPPTPGSWEEIVRAIFDRQRELMVKYKEIEQLPEAPISLHTMHGQRIIKDFAFRAIEELTESYEGWEKHQERQVQELHALEELADAMHFFVELLVFAGITPEQCLRITPTFDQPDYMTHFALLDESRYIRTNAYWRATYRIGLATNFLRNKPWKQSQVPTDENRFREACLDAFKALVQCWQALGYNESILFQFYMRKSEVNKFRQRSKY